MKAGGLIFHTFAVTALRDSCEIIHGPLNLGSEVNLTGFVGGASVMMVTT